MNTQEPGSEIAGYRIESLIGRGGMAVVYLAEDVRLGRKVALKLLTPQLADNEQFRQRFIRESRLAASLDHPNIVPIYEAGEANGELFIAMRYVLGSDLKGVLAAEHGKLSVRRTLGLFFQIGNALDSAHQAGLVHRDVKPANILVSARQAQTRHANGDHVYLTDFGLTKRTTELSGGLTGTGSFLGTVDYVSPEQIQGKPVGPATDVYALGCVLYESLTGQLPFHRDDDSALLWAHLVEPPPPVTSIRPELPGAVNAVVARAMAKDPSDRYQSCGELVNELELALGVPAPVHSPGGRFTGDGVGVSSADATSDSSRPELWTVTGNVAGGSEHPSFPSAPLHAFPALPDTSDGSAPPAAQESSAGEYTEYDEEYDEEYDGEYDPGHHEYDAGSGREGVEPVAPPPRRLRWTLVALVAAAAVLVAVAAVVLRSSFMSEDYRPYSSTETLVPFRLDRPAGWGAVVGPASDVVLAPDPASASRLFFLRGTPEAWASTAATRPSGSAEDVRLYVYTSATTFDTSAVQALRDSIAPLLPDTTQFAPAHREVSVAGGPADEMEAVSFDPANPQTRLRVLVDVVQPPGAGGAVLLAFFAPPDTFEHHRPTFERIRDSLAINH
jgi:serine/threonine protein kinase